MQKIYLVIEWYRWEDMTILCAKSSRFAAEQFATDCRNRNASNWYEVCEVVVTE